MGAAAAKMPPAAGQEIGGLTVFRDPVTLPAAPREAGLVGVALADEACRIRQRGQSIRLGPGDWTFYAPGALAGVEGRPPARAVLIPRQHLGEAGACLPAAWLDGFRGEAALNRVAFSMLAAVCDHAPGIDPASGEAVAMAAIHVLKRALAERAGLRRQENGLLRRVKELAEWRLRDPELSVGDLARSLGCTERSVQRAFHAEADTFQRYLLRRRLDGCRRDLASPALAGRSLTEVAFSYGFNSLAHFSRAYKERFGQAPSAARGAGT